MIDQHGNPIFGTAITPLTPLTLPVANTSASTSLANLVSSIGSTSQPEEEDSGSNTLALLLGALGNRAQATTTDFTVTGSSGKDGWASQIKQLSKKYGLDPHAVLAVASVEGLSGGVGDAGTSFGPLQLHVGGALPKGKGKAWAESPVGIKYAMQRIASVAKGLKGEAAIRAIVTKFERPANPAAEIQKALSRYGKVR